jgi:hypothetical protein
MIDRSDTKESRAFSSEEQRLEHRSDVFKKELGLTDLVLT